MAEEGAPYADEADYVVVGSGSSGAAIAGRLAESGASVIVVEAGKSDEQFLVKKPGMIGPMHSVPEIKKKVDWGFYSVPQKHLLDRKMPVPRGKVVGGSSSINGMVYVRGNRANYDVVGGRGQHRLGRRHASTRRTCAWRTSRTAPTTTAAPAARSR